MQHYKVIDSTWFSAGSDQLGAVVIETHGGLKCYLGISPQGIDQTFDEQRIAGQGAKITPLVADAMFPHHAGKFIM